MAFFGMFNKAFNKGARAAWKGGVDDAVVKTVSNNADDVVKKSAADLKAAQVVRFSNMGDDGLEEIANNIGKNNFVPKTMEEYSEKINKLKGDKKLGFNDEYVKNLRKEDIKKYNADTQDRFDILNAESKHGKRGQGTNKNRGLTKEETSEFSKMKSDRKKFEASTNTDDYRAKVEERWRNDTYDSLIEKDREFFEASNSTYKMGEVDITNRGVAKETGRGELGNYSQKARYLEDDAGNRRWFDVTENGVRKGPDGRYETVSRTTQKLGNMSEDSFGVGKSRKLEKMYQQNAPDTLSSNMIKTGIGIGVTGGAVLAMSSNRGQQTNGQLYGQY